MTIPEPHRSELRTEVRELAAAVVDVFRAMVEQPPNWERAGAAIERIDAVIVALDEMQDQEEPE